MPLPCGKRSRSYVFAERPRLVALRRSDCSGAARSASPGPLQRVRSRFPRTLTDRSVLGCAWFGAPDEVVVTAYLVGGLINLIGLLGMPTAVMTDVDMSSPLTPFAHWHAVPMMVFAFALIAARPVLEELLFRGVLFAALRQRLTTLAAAIVVSTLFALAHYAQLVVYPPAVLWIGAMGVLAMHLRLKHASLAPAIALHSGFNFMPVVFAVLN